ncbi:hypothetical protein BGZ97_006207 [Linnemannia gamsii]|uniref:Galactose oxidase n=1 Tax=Linnemannia gamsii TaxID=64522 RepID=A0A9P6URU6_9FUNG|nr:hypothetical protein BGZ97_006207 [Linnemannia gamsii]
MLFIHTLFHLLVFMSLLHHCVTQAEIVQQAPLATPTITKATTSTTSPTPTTTDPGLIGLPTLPPVPDVVVYPASCHSEGTWYIQGGFNLISYNQFYSLDLTKPWNTTWAPWVEYPDAPPLSTQNCLFVPKADSTIRFNNINNAYSTNISSSPILTGSATDPAGSVLAFIGNEDKGHPLISVLNMTTGTWHYNASSVLVPTRNPGIVVVANPLDGRMRSSILYLGGRIGETANYTSPEIIEYKPSSNTWALLPVTGTAPDAREDACMVTDKDNNRVVVFGGQNDNGSLSDIYILDMKTLVWTRGPSIATGRLGMACAMYDDGFLTWGGSTETFLVAYPSATPLVFNLTTMRWTDRYKQRDALDMVSDPNSNGGSKLGLILGLSIASAALLALAGGVYLFRRHKIEMSSMGPQGDGVVDIATSVNRYGDPTNISPASPSHAIAPYAAPSAPPNPDIRQR